MNCNFPLSSLLFSCFCRFRILCWELSITVPYLWHHWMKYPIHCMISIYRNFAYKLLLGPNHLTWNVLLRCRSHISIPSTFLSIFPRINNFRSSNRIGENPDKLRPYFNWFLNQLVRNVQFIHLANFYDHFLLFHFFQEDGRSCFSLLFLT